MADINEELKRVKDAEIEASRMVENANIEYAMRIEDAKKKASEIIKKAEEEIQKIREEMVKKFDAEIEIEENRIKEEWTRKIERLKNIEIDDNIIKEIVRNIMGGK